jgi:hypothetical protein
MTADPAWLRYIVAVVFGVTSMLMFLPLSHRTKNISTIFSLGSLILLKIFGFLYGYYWGRDYIYYTSDSARFFEGATLITDSLLRGVYPTVAQINSTIGGHSNGTVYMWFTGILNIFFNDLFLSSFVYSFSAYLIICVLIFKISELVGCDNRVSIFAVGLYLCLPLSSYYLLSPMKETSVSLWATLFTYVFLLCIKNPNKKIIFYIFIEALIIAFLFLDRFYILGFLCISIISYLYFNLTKLQKILLFFPAIITTLFSLYCLLALVQWDYHLLYNGFGVGMAGVGGTIPLYMKLILSPFLSIKYLLSPINFISFFKDKDSPGSSVFYYYLWTNFLMLFGLALFLLKVKSDRYKSFFKHYIFYAIFVVSILYTTSNGRMREAFIPMIVIASSQGYFLLKARQRFFIGAFLSTAVSLFGTIILMMDLVE